MPFLFRDKLFEYLTEHLTQYQASPSYADLASAMAISPRSKSLISRSLKQLEKEGKIVLLRKGRQVEIALSVKQLRILGRIAAGSPIEAIETPQVLDLQQLFQNENHFALQVHGLSMAEDGIFNGDIVICRSAPLAQEGETVVALINHAEVTLKLISYKTKSCITLLPVNSACAPQVYPMDEITIQGVFVGLLRMA